MFTGIIEETGIVKSITKTGVSASMVIEGSVIFGDLRIGDSVAVNGVCLTARSISGSAFTADVMNETFRRSSLGILKPGSRVNLERALTLNSRLGGHIVSGHIDGTGVIAKMEKDANAVWYTLKADSGIMRYVIEKGSVAIDGISLTVAKIDNNSFSVSVIPHTHENTILSDKKIGDIVNIENDIIGKYVERLLGGGKTDGGIMSLLENSGFLEV